jgi:hypothetical protein
VTDEERKARLLLKAIACPSQRLMEKIVDCLERQRKIKAAK